MSVQPSAFASAGTWVSFSQLRLGEWASVEAGVAWVSRVVVTMPVAIPASAACSHRVERRPSSRPVQSPKYIDWSTLISPARVFAPVAIALIVPAESGVCWSVL